MRSGEVAHRLHLFLSDPEGVLHGLISRLQRQPKRVILQGVLHADRGEHRRLDFARWGSGWGWLFIKRLFQRVCWTQFVGGGGWPGWFLPWMLVGHVDIVSARGQHIFHLFFAADSRHFMFFPNSLLYRIKLLLFDLFTLLVITHAHLVHLWLVQLSVT